MLPILLFVAFVSVPMVEIALFIQVGGLIGLWPTLLTVVLTAIIGTALLRQQGIKVLADAQDTINKGGMPVEQGIHGVFLLVSGLLLLTPGFMTDAIGFVLFVPPVRLWLGRQIFVWLKNNSTFTVYKSGDFTNTGPIFDDDTPFRPQQTADQDSGATTSQHTTNQSGDHGPTYHDNVIDLSEAAIRANPDPSSPWAKGADLDAKDDQGADTQNSDHNGDDRGAPTDKQQ